jgi:hypothetical protein
MLLRRKKKKKKQKKKERGRVDGEVCGAYHSHVFAGCVCPGMIQGTRPTRPSLRPDTTRKHVRDDHKKKKKKQASKQADFLKRKKKWKRSVGCRDFFLFDERRVIKFLNG